MSVCILSITKSTTSIATLTAYCYVLLFIHIQYYKKENLLDGQLDAIPQARHRVHVEVLFDAVLLGLLKAVHPQTYSAGFLPLPEAFE